MQRGGSGELNNFQRDTESSRAHRSETGSPSPRRVDLGDDYDPHVHRQVQSPTNDMETLFHILRLGLGTGILAMPQALANAGLITGIISTICIAVLITHCLKVLIGVQYGACKCKRVPLMSYADAARVTFKLGPAVLRSFSELSGVAIDIFLVTYQLGVCCIYIVFIADNTKKLCDSLFVFSVEMHMLFQLPLLVALNMTPNLKVLAPFSGAANIATLASLSIICYCLLTLERSTEPLDHWGSVYTFPLFLGTILFSLTGVGAMVTIEHKMKTPKSFGRPCGVLAIGMAFVTILFIGIGYIGYTFCVSKCRDVITLNLPPGPLTNIAIILYVFAIFFTYGLHCFVSVDMLWNDYILPRMQGASQVRLRCCEILLRLGLGIITFALAVMVPRLGLFISLFGALCLSAVGFCFPALMESCLWYQRPPSVCRTLMFLKDALLVIIGIVGLVSGTYSALLGIIRSFQ